LRHLNIIICEPLYTRLETYLTRKFEDWCPQWNKVITTTKADRWGLYLAVKYAGLKEGLDMIDSKRCIVGEAHGFKADYNGDCGECADFSYKYFIKLVESPEVREQFVRHMNEVHAVW
jgi:hypothetical protein